MRPLQLYLHLLKTHPYKTQATVTGGLFLISDIISQQLIEKKGLKSHDFIRTLRQTAVGFIITGPLIYKYYKTLEKFVGGHVMVQPIKKMIIDQTLFAPSYICMYFAVIGYTSGMDTTQVKEKLQKDFKSTMIMNWKVWPFVQICNFYFIPLQHRAITTNSVAVIWNTYLSWKANAVKNDDVTSQ
ncbi:mitochondrial inner membrane protein Mpv17-like [Antedon mediterranea]|uniref:mitochondrial inner membrane protein Mpv17-like n=1 Tax=Antedon mediterranea TaxID=105859 RepID=UPI003AF97F5D